MEEEECENVTEQEITEYVPAKHYVRPDPQGSRPLYHQIQLVDDLSPQERRSYIHKLEESTMECRQNHVFGRACDRPTFESFLDGTKFCSLGERVN